MGSNLAETLEVTDGEVADDESTSEETTSENQEDGVGTEEAGGEEKDEEGDGESGASVDRDTGDVGDSSNDNEASDVDQLKEIQNNMDELRQILRVTKRENASLRAKVNRIDGNLQVDSDLDEEDGGEGTELSKIEELQNVVNDLGQRRGAQLDLLAEQMQEMNKYSDVMDVCSKVNVDTVVESAAKAIVEDSGGDMDEIMLELEIDIWRRPNPYKYLYGIIKEHHPKYAGKAGKGKDESLAKVDKALKNKAASSIQDMGGSGGSKGGGWTADRIDRLPENELNTVPQDVYKKYMDGTLK